MCTSGINFLSLTIATGRGRALLELVKARLLRAHIHHKASRRQKDAAQGCANRNASNSTGGQAGAAAWVVGATSTQLSSTRDHTTCAQ